MEGVGLHTGSPARVHLEVSGGPIRLRSQGAEAAIDDWVVASSVRSTTVQGRVGAPTARTVEHLLAALGGLEVHRGMIVSLDGPEVPLVDGGARAWCDAVAQIAAPRGGRRLQVVRDGVIAVGETRFEFARGTRVEVSVHVEFGDGRIFPRAEWHGDPDDFRTRIAPARTFAFARDLADLSRADLARHVDPAAVVLLAPDTIHHAGAPFSPDEPARHKLLDLIGDLYVFGGPPVGRVHAYRPGHAANAEAARQALECGLLAAL